MRARLVAGNWKMHGSLASNQRLLEAVKGGASSAAGVEIAVCVPFPYLQQAASALAGSPVAWGGQTLSEHDSGAFTGEVSGAMLRDLGCRYVIVGHSERRALFGERDAQIAAKFAAAQRVGLIPILCLGETLEEREQGATEEVVGRQLRAVIDGAGVGALADAAIAYEPVWAIGTGRTASPDQAQAVHAFIRALVGAADAAVGTRLPLLYGGSVKPGNARELFAMPDVDGGLIGGASLVAEDFLAICRAGMPEGN
ncbi:MAG TPA: triose-phosphate isomerase [Burkholderiales bacterium]|nr:triose-phosphate isomerase [Burkholderiales bacterium]